MASTKISDETTASSLTGTELVPVVQSGSNRKTTVGDIARAGFGFTAVSSNTTLGDYSQCVEVDTSGVTAPGTLTITLPSPRAGRAFFIRKTLGAANETITLARSGSEQIDNASASRLLTGSDQEVISTFGGLPFIGWIVWSDGTDWVTMPIGTSARHWIGTGAPVDGTHNFTSEVGVYMPGSTWSDSSSLKLYMAMCVPSLGNVSWHRVDAVDNSSVTGNTTLPSKDHSLFVSTASGAVTVTLPDPTGRNAGRQFSITKTNTGTNKIVLARHGSESINGAASNLDPLTGSDAADYGRWHVVSDGTDWWVTGGSGLV